MVLRVPPVPPFSHRSFFLLSGVPICTSVVKAMVSGNHDTVRFARFYLSSFPFHGYFKPFLEVAGFCQGERVNGGKIHLEVNLRG